MKNLSENKKVLVEDIGVNLETNQKLPPLAARIYGLLVLSPKSGHFFGEIVEMLDSSKSSVSTSLKLLLEKGVIEYFTKSGERKRYFRLSGGYLEVNLNKYKERVSGELVLLDKIDTYNKQYNKDKFEKHREVGLLYKEYLKAHLKNLERTIDKMNNLKQTV